MKRISDILDEAAGLIEGPGAWGRGSRRSSPCLIEALAKVWGGGYDSKWVDALKPLRRVVGSDVASWNDHPDRTQEEAVAALRQAAELARKDGK